MKGTVRERMDCQATWGRWRMSWILILLFYVSSCRSIETHPGPASLATYKTPKALAADSWDNLQLQIRSAVVKARQFSVAVYPEGRERGGSGCVIMEDGLILTAAHVVNLLKPGETSFTVQFHNGDQVQAVPVGANFTSDLALLKIVNPTGKRWPAAVIAESSPAIADPTCFLGYPGKNHKEAEAHVRFGFINYKRKSRTVQGLSVMMVCDIPIQPGDSGGPLISMDGRLVGIASSAGEPLNYNRFVPIELYHRDKVRLIKGDRWGDITKGPTRSKLRYRLDQTGVARLRAEFKRRVSAKWPGAVALAQKTTLADGRAYPDAQQLVDLMNTDIEPVTLAQPFSSGKYTPAPVPALESVRNAMKATVAELQDGVNTIGFAVAVSPSTMVAKHSLVTPGINVRINGKNYDMTLISSEPELDLALLKIDGAPRLTPVKWHVQVDPSGTVLVAFATAPKPLGWGIISGRSMSVNGGDDKTGPIPKDCISSHRGPYKKVVAHDIPVYANDMGSLVLDLQGNTIGFNIARKNRTQAMMIPAEAMAEAVQTMARGIQLKAE